MERVVAQFDTLLTENTGNKRNLAGVTAPLRIPLMHRRRFLRTAAALAAVGAATRGTSADPLPPAEPSSIPLVDTNVWLGHWPTRRAPVDSSTALRAHLQARGVSSAWIGHFDAALHTDIDAVNARLAAACEQEGGGFFLPFGALNPTLPDWEEDLRRCHEVHRMPGLRLLPAYHGYTLDDPRFARVLEQATARHLVIQIALTMEDERSQNPVFAAPPTVAAPLAPLVEKNPRARVMVLNATSRLLAAANPLLRRLAKAGVQAEIATLEGAAGLANVLAGAPDLALCFGSHTPYFYFEAARLKLDESPLTPAQFTAIASGHASALLARV